MREDASGKEKIEVSTSVKKNVLLLVLTRIIGQRVSFHSSKSGK